MLLGDPDPPTPVSPAWVYWVAGVCGVLLVAMVILMLVMPYVMWRRRVILVMKLVHYFQGYEDDGMRATFQNIDFLWDEIINNHSPRTLLAFLII